MVSESGTKVGADRSATSEEKDGWIDKSGDPNRKSKSGGTGGGDGSGEGEAMEKWRGRVLSGAREAAPPAARWTKT